MSPTNPKWLIESRAFLEFDDWRTKSPVAPPRCTLFEMAEYDTKSEIDYWFPGYRQSHVAIESFLIHAGDADRCKQFDLCDCRAVCKPFIVDDDRNHQPGGTRMHDGVETESIYFDHPWDGMGGKSLIIPSQALILYLGLMQDGNDHANRVTWTDPLDAREVLERQGRQHTGSDSSLRIDLDYLRDFLAARRKCLFVFRWGQRFVNYSMKDTLPWTERRPMATSNGAIEFEGPYDVGGTGHPALRATLREWYLVKPASKPRHFMLDSRGEHVGDVEFTGPDGNPVQLGGHKNSLRVISFRRDVLSLFNSPDRPRWEATNMSPGQLAITFPRGSGLWASDSPHGQVQALHWDLAKLDEEYQRVLAPFSEMERGKPHTEWFNTGFMCEPAEDLPWHERIQNAHVAANRALARITIRNPIRGLTTPFDGGKLLRPSANDEEEFFRVAKHLRRVLLDEGQTTEWFVSAVHPSFLPQLGSIGAIKALLRRHDPANLDSVGSALDAINKFRQVDAHSAEASKALDAADYSKESDYATRYDRMMRESCEALERLAAVASAIHVKLAPP